MSAIKNITCRIIVKKNLEAQAKLKQSLETIVKIYGINLEHNNKMDFKEAALN